MQSRDTVRNPADQARSRSAEGTGSVEPVGEALPLYTDLYDPKTRLIIEAKGTATREAVRMAVGQLLDYRRFVDRPNLAVLVPEMPRRDLLEYLRSNHISVIAQTDEGRFGTVEHAGQKASTA